MVMKRKLTIEHLRYVAAKLRRKPAPIFCLNALFSTTLEQTRVQFKSTTLSINIPIDRVPLQTRDVQNWNSGLFFQAYDVQAKNENKLRFL